MKYVILIIIVVIFAYLGYGLSTYYTNRKKFFNNLVFLFEKLNLEINFSQPKLISIMQEFNTQNQNKDICKLIKNYTSALEKNEEMEKTTLFKDIKILKDEEKNIIHLFFVGLGKLDVINQTKQLDSQKIELKIFATLFKTWGNIRIGSSFNFIIILHVVFNYI